MKKCINIKSALDIIYIFYFVETTIRLVCFCKKKIYHPHVPDIGLTLFLLYSSARRKLDLSIYERAGIKLTNTDR